MSDTARMTDEMSQTLSDLEAACCSAHAMKATGELTEDQYQQINNTIAGWENMLKDMHRQATNREVMMKDIHGSTICVERLTEQERANWREEHTNASPPFAVGSSRIVVPLDSADRFAYMTGLSQYDEKPSQYIIDDADLGSSTVYAVWCIYDHEREDEDKRIDTLIDQIRYGCSPNEVSA
tara:strand:- start:20623 stop:21165 length:543 start_codon:yes stop_codon:yes gene_type:complete